MSLDLPEFHTGLCQNAHLSFVQLDVLRRCPAHMQQCALSMHFNHTAW